MALQSPDARQNHRDRMRHMRLQRKRGGDGWQLPSARRGPIVKPPSDPNADYSHLESQGVQIWKNRKNKFCVIRVHYTADPEKRDPKYAIEGRASNPQGWDQEMEIDFASKKGIRAFSEFPWARGECDLGEYWSSESNIILPSKKAPGWWRLYLTTDPGRNRHWATLFVLVDEYECWHVVASLVKPGMHYTEAKLEISKRLGGRRPVEHIIDPASKQQRTDSERTLIEKMAKRPIPMECIPPAKRNNEYVGLEELRERMMRREDGRFGMYFWDTPGNQEAIRQFKFAVYADDYGEKLIEEDVDSVDAARYLVTHLTHRAVRPRKPVDKMNHREFRAHLAVQRRRAIEKRMTEQQMARDGLQADQIYFDDGREF